VRGKSIEEENMAENGSNLRCKVMIGLFVAVATLWISPASAQDAGGTYKAKCAVCHGADGKGDTPVGKKMGVHDFSSSEVQKETDDALIAVVASGRNKMPPYGKSLNAGQIKDLVAYIRTLGKK
jgi:mono/diheme cytochrome c family protein